MLPDIFNHMVNNNTDQLDRVFHALSDSTRRKILTDLAKRERSVSELAAPHDQTLAGISKHLKVLESAELVRKIKEGRVITCHANLTPLSEVYATLEELGAFWRSRLDALELLLTNPSTVAEKIDEKPTRSPKSAKGNRKKSHSR
jgi:DNA-binding transcriptional ArsR family regulator